MSVVPNGPGGSAIDHGVSLRSLKLMKGPLPYVGAFIKAMSDPWTPSNPGGWIPLVVAENKLSNDALLHRMAAVTASPAPRWTVNYGDFKGAPPLRAAFAALLNRTFVPRPTLDPDHFCLLSGCTGVLENLFTILGDAGDSVLIPAPYYPAFDNDLEAKAGMVPVPFYLEGGSEGAGDGRGVAAQLERLAEEAAAAGRPARVLLLTNPNNPLGTIYSDDLVKEMLRWALKNKVHVVSDEIYALSVFEGGAPFLSALSLAQDLVDAGEASQEGVDTWVHLVYGLSKDWCASGLRVGLVHSRNAPLHAALLSLAGFSGISNLTQHILAEVLSDEAWTTQFVNDNAAKLRASYDELTVALEKAGVPYVPAAAAMFVWIDLRAWLAEPTWEGEAALWQRVCDECKVVLTPGSSCHAAEPGFFRLCFAWVEKEALREAVGRMATVLGEAGAAAAQKA